MPEVLSNTEPFEKSRLFDMHGFEDHYPKQWESTLKWMKRALRDAAKQRDESRRIDADHGWLKEQRGLLGVLTGYELFAGEAAEEAGTLRLMPYVPVQAVAGALYSCYELQMNNGLVFSGCLAVPESSDFAGLIVYSDPQEDIDCARSQSVVHSYVQSGYCVMMPLLAKESRNYGAQEGRKWYRFNDAELIQLYSFVCGGSLAGLEAFELYATSAAIAAELGFKEIPVILDCRGRHLLAATVAAALHPDWANIVRLDEQAERLNAQERDGRANTVWSFHKHFDLLTLLQLSGSSQFLFAERGPTPTACAAQAIVFFDSIKQGDHHAPKVLRCEPENEADALLLLLPPVKRKLPVDSVSKMKGTAPCNDSVDCLYSASLSKKMDYLEGAAIRARESRAGRYDLASMSMEDYSQRVGEAIAAVMGEPLPRADHLRVRTRKVTAFNPAIINAKLYDTYEVMMETIPGLETAGYFLLPKGEGPFPAVICQHGLMGRPEDVMGLTTHWIYSRVAAGLAEKGYAIFIPFMNWGWGGTAYRDQLAKHAFALGITPNRFESAQLSAVVDFLQARPEVKRDRIAFYGLSYGGHASVWLGACEPRLAAVVTAGHFSDWHKNLISTEISPPCEEPTSYLCVDEGMDMFYFNVLRLLGHAELTTHYAPRPYMVENGIYDWCAPIAFVNAEFERVQAVYEKAGGREQAALSHFEGPHRIWGEESLLFLRRHLKEG